MGGSQQVGGGAQQKTMSQVIQGYQKNGTLRERAEQRIDDLSKKNP